MSTIEQKFRVNQETLAYLRSKENIQASIQANPQYWKELAIEEDVLRSLLTRRTRDVKSTLDRGFNLFALALFTFFTVCAFSLFDLQNFIHFNWERQLAELALQLGLVSLSTIAFFMCLSHFRSTAQ